MHLARQVCVFWRCISKVQLSPCFLAKWGFLGAVCSGMETLGKGFAGRKRRDMKNVTCENSGDRFDLSDLSRQCSQLWGHQTHPATFTSPDRKTSSMDTHCLTIPHPLCSSPALLGSFDGFLKKQFGGECNTSGHCAAVPRLDSIWVLLRSLVCSHSELSAA